MSNTTVTFRDRRYDAERSLYGLRDAEVISCTFAGEADGESVLKECHRFSVTDCDFSLRYPMWHAEDFALTSSRMDEKARAALWYAHRGRIADSDLRGIKALRECTDISLHGCNVDSPEFGWKCSGIRMDGCSVNAEYLFLDSRELELSDIRMSGKYSFQYTENVSVRDSVLDTKDAFWHAKNVTVRDCVLKGEYLAWFSDGLTLINCEIGGTQPFCYCKNLKLVNCRMSGTDLSFEYSDVDADIVGHVDSVKNPRSGRILLDSVGEIVRDAPVMECHGEVVLRGAAEIKN